jgi:uncharacterized membrane protein
MDASGILDMVIGLILIFLGIAMVGYFSSVRNKHYKEYINRKADEWEDR